MDWWPISTAPKDRYLMGAWRDGKWQAAEMWWNDQEEEWNHTTGDHIIYPTVWTYLPEERPTRHDTD